MDAIKKVLNCVSNSTESKSSENNIVSNKSNFNIFKVLRIENREIYICRVIGELLNPKGSHGCGTLFLELFFKVVLKREFNLDEYANASVTLEDSIDDNRRVDIVIEIVNDIFPIEVKIWAGDQYKQLEDYYKYYFKQQDETKKIFYLTPNGHGPSAYSMGKLNEEQIIQLSFKEDITSWLNTAIEQIKDNSDTYDVYVICSHLVDIIGDMVKEYEMKERIIKSVFEKQNNQANTDNINAAFEIAENIDYIRQQFISDFLHKYTRNILGEYECYGIQDITENEKKQDLHRQKAITNKNKITIAYLCVATNLYLAVATNCAVKGEKDWKDSCWTHIFYTADKTKDEQKINLKYPSKEIIEAAYSRDIEIKSIAEYLKDIEIKENHL